MKIHLRADSANGSHTRLTIFMNGARCGQLTMREDEAVFFHHTIMQSNWIREGEAVSSGTWERGQK